MTMTPPEPPSSPPRPAYRNPWNLFQVISLSLSFVLLAALSTDSMTPWAARAAPQCISPETSQLE